jgi:hypothetical protein
MRLAYYLMLLTICRLGVCDLVRMNANWMPAEQE